MSRIEISHAPGGGFMLCLSNYRTEFFSSISEAFLRAADVAGWSPVGFEYALQTAAGSPQARRLADCLRALSPREAQPQ